MIAVVQQELRDLWVGGRGLALCFGYSLLLSVIAYLTATNQALNYLEQRETVNLTLQVAIAAGALLTLIAAADAVSGERERGTLESLLLSPVSRVELAAGKLLAALSLGLAAFAIAIPYLWFLGRGIGIVGNALAVAFVVGGLLAVFLASLGLLVSIFAGSNRVSLSTSLFMLLALFAPTQLPAGAQQGWAGELLLRLNPVTAGLHYVGRILVNGHPWSEDVAWLASPLVAAAIFAAAALGVGGRSIRLRAAVVAAALLVLAVPVASASAGTGAVTVSVDRTSVSTRLGQEVVLRTTVANKGAAPARGLIAHLNVVSLRGDVYVDPEDWSSQRTRFLAPVAAGTSTTLSWPIKAVNPGSIGVYVAVLPARAGARPVAGPTVQIEIADRRTLDSGGILPLALGIPAALAAALLARRAASRGRR